jgi:hypothetical protein
MEGQRLLIEQVVRGLAIIGKHPRCHIAAQQDVIHAGIDDPTLLTIDDVKELLQLGWHQTQLGWARWLS